MPGGRGESVPGFVKCEPCELGQEAPNSGMASCMPCGVGFYADVAGSAECSKCPGTFTTKTEVGVGQEHRDSLGDCTCAPGSYWNRKDHVCVECSFELRISCPGGLELPVIFEGFYGAHRGDVDAATIAQQDADMLAGRYNAGEWEEAYKYTSVYQCQNAMTCPGEDTTIEGQAFKKVRVGYPLEGSCPEHREGIACARCEEGYVGGKGSDCNECDDGDTAVLAILVILVPLVVPGIYRFTSSPSSARVTGAFVLFSTAGMCAFFFQTMAVFDSFSISWPDELAWLFELSRFFMFDFSMLPLIGCAHGDDFIMKYWATILIPLALLLLIAVAALVSRILPMTKETPMMFNPTFSMIGMFGSALYITLVKVVLLYFECSANPLTAVGIEPKRTMAKYRDIECDSEKYSEGLAPMAIGMVLYVFGFYLMIVYAAYAAPVNAANRAFCERFKFLFQRWRPETYHWGVAIMTRNLAVACAGLVSDDPRAQLTCATNLVTVYMVLTAIKAPWRSATLNYFDVGTCFLLTLMGTMGTVFFSVNAELALSERVSGNEESVEAGKDLVQSYTRCLSTLMAIFTATFGFIIGWSLNFMRESQREKAVAKNNELVNSLVADLRLTVEKAGGSNEFCEIVRMALTRGTEYFQSEFASFISRVQIELNFAANPIKDTMGKKAFMAGMDDKQKQKNAAGGNLAQVGNMMLLGASRSLKVGREPPMPPTPGVVEA